MIQRTYVGLFDTELSLIGAIEELEHKGIAPENMYIIAKSEEDVEILRRRTYSEIQSAPSNWIDRFIGYISGENHIRSMLVDVGFDEADIRRYEAEIQQGKWLLYVEGELEKTAYEINADRGRPETNPFGHTASEAERLNEEKDHSPTGIANDGLPRNEYRDSVMKQEGNSYNTPQGRRSLGRVGAEALYDKTDYAPNSDQRPRPSLVRGTPKRERKHLQSLSRQERRTDFTDVQKEFPTPSEQSRTSLPHPNNITESQIDRQDGLAEMTDSTTQVPNEKVLKFKDINQPNEPIIIDLRGIKKTKDEANLWLIQDEDDFRD